MEKIDGRKKLKFGYHTIRWGFAERITQPLPTILHEISSAGFEGFETHEEDISLFLKDKNKFLSLLSETKIQLASIYVHGNFIRGDMDFFNYIRRGFPLRKEIRRIAMVAEFAASVGCKRLVLGGGRKRKGGATKKDYVNMASALNKIGKICNNVNIEATYHPHLGAMIEQLDEIDRLYELIDPDLVYLTIDTAHLTAAGVDLIQLINTYRKRINHVHFKDLSNGKFVELGEGTINFPSIINSLKSINYNGWIIVEDEVDSGTPYAGSSTKSPFESAKNSKKYIDTYLR